MTGAPTSTNTLVAASCGDVPNVRPADVASRYVTVLAATCLRPARPQPAFISRALGLKLASSVPDIGLVREATLLRPS